MTTPIQSFIPMRGDLTVTPRDVKTGKVLRTYIIRNTITFLGMAAVVQLLSQRAADPAASTLKISELWVGEGSTAPVRGDTGLADGLGFAHKIILVDANKIPNISNPFELRIACTLGAGDANGKDLQEAGLFTPSGDMLARQVHPLIAKTAAIAIDYDWRLAFTA